MSVADNQLASLYCLVVEDDAFARDLLVTTLKSLGVKDVLTAASGSAAFEAMNISKRKIDVVLADIRMPSGNGLQLLKALRSGVIKTMRLDATFLLVTAFPSAGAVKIASSLDANGFIVKPFVPEKLETSLLKARRTVFPAIPSRYAEVTVPAEL
jgi:two-component system chemotaxis response regulator CheY